ncbi:unnamed protein product [Hermetia illucens]|uniref:Uncharacterized protein n=1 Tax=Hermetia illucens TaxID=343691 RepID=A0A7R8YWI5_HERIL|nr:hemicentin-1 [Hermetia illucens]CAD7087963.1 unnamed protein product [Hermetia illucens]
MIKFIFLAVYSLGVVWCQLDFGDDKVVNKNFKSAPTTIKTYENDTVLLPCNYNTPSRYVRWHRDDVLLVDSRHPEIPPPERVHLWTNGSLQVSRVKDADSGEYYCEVMAEGGRQAVQIHAIEVQYPPAVLASPNGVVELPVGSVFEILCEARGFPIPIITWRRNGIEEPNEKMNNRRRLLVEVESRDMAGLIECIANNGVGQPAVDGVHLSVLFKPEVKAVTNVVHTKIGMRAHLECVVEAAPAATVHWFHHGVPVQPDIRIARHDSELQTNHSLAHYFTESKHILVIKKVKDHDLGMYECRAENRVGFKGEVIELTGRPMACVFKSSPIASTPTTHNLIWQTESLSPIIEYKLKFRQVPSGNVTPQNRFLNVGWNELTIPSEFSEGPMHTTSYSLKGLQPASVYEVAVTSRNRYGWSDNSKIVRFATGGEIQLENYSTESDIHYEDMEDNYITDLTTQNQDYIRYAKTLSQYESSKTSKINLSIFVILGAMLIFL